MNECSGAECCADDMIYVNGLCTSGVDENNNLLNDSDGVSPFNQRKMNKINNFCKKKCNNIKKKKKRRKCKKKCREEQLLRRDWRGRIVNETDSEEEDEEDAEAAAYDLKYQKLKDAWQNSQITLQEAPEKEKLAEKNFFTWAEGDSGWNERLLERYTKTADNLRRKSIKEHNEVIKLLKTLLAKYRSQTIYIQRMNELYKVRLNENKKLKGILNNEISSTLTNDRRVAYEEHEFYGLDTFRNIIKYLYFGLLIVFIIFGNFFKDALYKDPKVWIGILLYIVFPFILSFIPIGIFYIVEKIRYLLENKAPKNVYVDL